MNCSCSVVLSLVRSPTKAPVHYTIWYDTRTTTRISATRFSFFLFIYYLFFFFKLDSSRLYQVFRLFLDKGADVNHANRHGETALHQV